MQNLNSISPDDARQFFTGNPVDFIEKQFPEVYNAIARRANGYAVGAAKPEETPAEPPAPTKPRSEFSRPERIEFINQHGLEAWEGLPWS